MALFFDMLFFSPKDLQIIYSCSFLPLHGHSPMSQYSGRKGLPFISIHSTKKCLSISVCDKSEKPVSEHEWKCQDLSLPKQEVSKHNGHQFFGQVKLK